MGATFAEVKRLSRRSNHTQNQRTMFFSSRVSIYITYLLSKTPMTANGVTYIFTVVGLAASAVGYLPVYWAPMLGFALYRLHVILDVVDGELARYRKSCSPIGAYLDFLTHYFVYTTAVFGFGVNCYLVTGNVAGIFLGFAISIGLMMNLASKDTWYRANFGKDTPVEGDEKLWNNFPVTLLAVRVCSINTIWFLYAAAALAGGLAGVTILGREPTWYVLVFYAPLLPLFAVARIVMTMKHRRIPRRAAWYK
jgi:phosphatidylglycerophosphate synthase